MSYFYKLDNDKKFIRKLVKIINFILGNHFIKGKIFIKMSLKIGVVFYNN